MDKMIPTRNAFGDEIAELGMKNNNIYVVECDISKSTKTDKFAKLMPERHINVGIAEQNAAGVAAGLATIGKIPFVSTYAVFGSMRMCEQVRTSICYPNLNVKIACSHGGLTPGSDGVTHQAIEDMGIYRTIPGMTVIMPSDYYSTRKLVAKAAGYYGPVYLRFTRDPVPVFYNENEKFEIGKGKVLKEGRDITIIAIGDMLHQALEAVNELERMGTSVELIEMHTLKPLDTELVLRSLNKTKKIITVENHNYLNGLGSAVADVIAEAGKGILRKVGLKDTFAESGGYYELLRKYEMDSKYIIKMAEELL
ncbi:MAG: transketolase C-terminal domain-containing protein [Clostridiales bacterium]|nr:transketolase C-terminal domain-containing protein [Clostridiales bacterium]